jgi:hypothetical protein
MYPLFKVPWPLPFRYGDMLNPWGDLITMARAWCLVKPDGLALVGVPTGMDQVPGAETRGQCYGFVNIFAPNG